MVTTPANTWSNLAFVFLGIWLWRKGRREGSWLKWLGLVEIIVGVTSLLFHASFTFFFQFFDYAGMFIFLWLLLTFSLMRTVKVSRVNQIMFYFGGLVLSLAAFLAFRAYHLPVQTLFAAEVGGFLLWEAGLWVRNGGVRYRHFVYTALLLLAAFTLWMLDYTRIFCDPANHLLQGHALWHVFSAFAFVTAFNFYKQFGFKK